MMALGVKRKWGPQGCKTTQKHEINYLPFCLARLSFQEMSAGGTKWDEEVGPQDFEIIRNQIPNLYTRDFPSI